MEAILIINSTDFTPWLAAGGLQQGEVSRCARTVVTLDGTAHRSEILKRTIAVSLVELRDDTWHRLLAALRTRPAAVHYIDDSAGEATRLFYVSSPTASAKTVRGGHTYFTGGAFTLEEK